MWLNVVVQIGNVEDRPMISRQARVIRNHNPAKCDCGSNYWILQLIVIIVNFVNKAVKSPVF